jgi:hypothetical protein
MKELASRADARWAAKPSALDKQAAQHQLPSSMPPKESTPRDFEHQAQVQETVGEAARDLARETPMERQEVASPDATPQDTLSIKPEERPGKAREFKGYKLGKEGEQQPDSWTPKAAARRR